MYGLKKYVPEHQVLEVRYEKLVGDPASEMRRIFGFLGLTADQALLDQISESVRPSQTAQQRMEGNEKWVALMAHIGPSLISLDSQNLI
jgi:hypothetical protein